MSYREPSRLGATALVWAFITLTPGCEKGVTTRVAVSQESASATAGQPAPNPTAAAPAAPEANAPGAQANESAAPAPEAQPPLAEPTEADPTAAAPAPAGTPPGSNRATSGRWTKEAIAADPEGYINWSLDQFDVLEKSLKGHRILVQAVVHKFDRESAADQALAAPRTNQEQELIALYRQREAKGAWPVTYRGVQVDKQGLKRLILQSHRTNARTEQRATIASAAKLKADKQARDIEEKLAAIQTQRLQLLESKRLLQLNRDISQLKKVMEPVNDLIDRTGAVADFANVEVDAADFLPTAREQADDDEFARIVGGKSP